jgi:putative sporulation protein YyaC
MLKHRVIYYPSGIKFPSEDFANQLDFMIRQEKNKNKILILCIGSDRSTGDSLGPLVGHLLSKKENLDLEILGTLKNPVHAVNLPQVVKVIKEEYSDFVVIAIDASIGKKEHISQITLAKDSISPGLGVSKNLERIGDIAITGIVGSGNGMEPLLLQNTRLSMVMELADCISNGIAKLEEIRKKKQSVERFLISPF